jgi:hypothetical protein
MDVVYNAKPAIENALRSAGWMMSNIVKNIGFSAEASKDYVAPYEALATRKEDGPLAPVTAAAGVAPWERAPIM